MSWSPTNSKFPNLTSTRETLVWRAISPCIVERWPHMLMMINCWSISFRIVLWGVALSWYMNLERVWIHTWKDLAKVFLKQYNYNMDMATDQTRLQNMMKKKNKAFKEYAQRWKGVAAQVQPPLSKKDMVTMFIDMLQSPFYDRMIGNISSNFSY